MKFLADVNVGRLIIAVLENRGHDVLRASSFRPGMPDDEILRIARADGRIVITSDKDFGDLVFRHGFTAIGVILLRIDVAREVERAAIFEKFWLKIEKSVVGHFIVVTSTVVRRTRLP